MKLTKQQIKNHLHAVEILKKPSLEFWPLPLDGSELECDNDWQYVYENWLPGYGNRIGLSGSFFTPLELARGFAYFAGKGRVIDLCAGTGILSYCLHRYHMGDNVELTCLERNPEFVEIGKKLLPEATWILGDVLDEELIRSLGQFDFAISNPPFGNIKSRVNDTWLRYRGPDFEYKVVEAGGHLAERGTFLLPQESVPWRYSGTNQCYESTSPKKYQRFTEKTGIELDMNAGYDCGCYFDQWKGTRIMTEIALVDYPEIPERISAGSQLDLFSISA